MSRKLVEPASTVSRALLGDLSGRVWALEQRADLNRLAPGELKGDPMAAVARD